ncbi:JAB domain-containing protein [Duffyella gerundensis]|jgi:DNA repair protein RadC|uniref:RadC family protein n=1 Tax=Duffyella TaxID=3026546 RepID=UPI001CE29312|nr:DNA repair protein RadC [Duffyella gerundensis]UCB32778.1 JAB domain-containing protein [Duffyella gerundensis]
MEKVSGSLPPREKLQQQGASALSDAELLAIFLRTGASGVPVLMLAQRMLNEFGSLYNIMTAGQADFSHIKGVGEAKLAQLHAIAELGKRFFSTQLLSENALENPQATYHYLQSVLAHQEREIFMALFLDNRHRVLLAQTMFSGSINSVEVHPREIIREALKINAASLILAHNHPSGFAEPSQADRFITDKIKDACILLNIRLLDHIVIGRGEFVSFAERGWL